MTRILTNLALFETDLPTVFAEYMKAVQDLRIGSERLHLDRKILQQKDVMLEATNRRFRDHIFDACWTIINRFAE
jgi:hypothetical protein